MSGKNAGSILVVCVPGTTIGVAVSGLNVTATLESSLGATAVISGNGTMPGVYNGSALVTLKVASVPTHQNCVVLNGTGLAGNMSPKPGWP